MREIYLGSQTDLSCLENPCAITVQYNGADIVTRKDGFVGDMGSVVVPRLGSSWSRFDLVVDTHHSEKDLEYLRAHPTLVAPT